MILPVHSDGDHVHEAGGNVSVEEERKDPAQLGTQGPLFVHISETWGINMKMKVGMKSMKVIGIKTTNTMKVLKAMKMMGKKMMYLDAVRGRLMALKRRSETAKLILKSDY